MKRLMLCALILAPLFLSGCVLDTIMSDFINATPSAMIHATPKQGAAPLTVSLDGLYSRDPDGAIAEYRWNLGDPTATGSKLGDACEHTFVRPGTYLVKLTVTDDKGAMDSYQIAIVVTDPPPVAQATASKDSPLPGSEVLFDGSASYDLDGAIVNYVWDFGDGGIAQGITATHAYAEGGQYVVTLTVCDNNGALGEARLRMNVQPGRSRCTDPPDATCGGSDDSTSGAAVIAVVNGVPSGCFPAKVGEEVKLDGTFSRSEVGNIVKYEWNLGDGTTASGPRVNHVYDSDKTYLISLTVTDEYGNVGSCTIGCPIVSAGGTCY